MPFRLPRTGLGIRQNPLGGLREQEREIEAARNWEVEGPVSFDATGTAVRMTIAEPPHLILYEIKGEWEACESCSSSGSGSSGSSSGSSSGDVIFPNGWCRAAAVPVLYYRGGREWDEDLEAAEVFIFHPAGHPPKERDAMVANKVFMPRFSIGDQVWCTFNMQSGWWEILHGFRDRWRFELATQLVPGESATAYLRQAITGECDWARCNDVLFTVCDSMEMFAGVVGAFGLAEYWADSRTWEIYQMECP